MVKRVSFPACDRRETCENPISGKRNACGSSNGAKMQNIMDLTKPFPLQREESEDFTGIKGVFLPYGFPASFDRGLQLHRARSGLGFVVMNLGVFAVFDQWTVAPNLTIHWIHWTPRSKGEEALKILAEGPEQQVSGA